ncbi:unnamed protein product [Boreogadus saida]
MDTISSSFLVILFLGINYSSSDILHRQKRTWIIDTFAIEEEYSGTHPYVLGKIELENKFTLMKLHGQGVDEEPKGKLEIDPDTGIITVLGKLDYEKNQRLMMKFEAVDRLSNVVDTKLSVEVQILDVNDNVPTFTQTYYMVHMKESAPQGSYVIVVSATDLDNRNSKNGTFDFKIVSVTPEPSDLEFYMEKNSGYGNISFRGCLDYEKSKTYTILVEVKDHGEAIQLSSTCTVVVNIDDENNHLPVFTGPSQSATLEEGIVGVEVLRMQATDRDTEGTDAWKVNYVIHGKSGVNFRIVTDPETNEGVLSVIKPLDFEDQSLLNLTISVENYGKYFSCKVVNKNVNGIGHWKVLTTNEKPELSTKVVILNVLDVNSPPVFKPKNKTVMVYEDISVGYNLGAMTAVDRDVAHGNKIRYFKGEDPAKWVTVDPKNGVITTVKTLDRESSDVKKDIYAVTVLGVDDGEPPATGTGTLFIHLRDRNDNTPLLDATSIGICISDNDADSKANITAFDHDLEPFAGPFTFKLLGDVKDKWRVEPEYGYSVNLFREDRIPTGQHVVQLKVSDQQGNSALHNVTVIVCECAATNTGGMPSCLERQRSSSIGFSGAAPIGFIALLLLLGILLLGLLLSCKKEVMLMPDEGTEQNLIRSNSEQRGSDCKMSLKALHEREDRIQRTCVHDIGYQTADLDNDVFPKLNTSFCDTHNGYTSANSFMGGAQNGSTRIHSSMRRTNVSFRGTSNGYTGTNGEHHTALEDILEQRNYLQQFIDRRVGILQAPGEEVGDYAPHLYGEEGHPDSSQPLEPIPIQEVPFHPDMLQNLDTKFNTLASLCSPEIKSS